MPPEDLTRTRLERSLNSAEQVLLEGRDRVSELRAPARDGATLGDALSRIGEDLAEEHGPTFIATRRGEGEPLPDRVFDEARHIGAEALLNAFRHAGASQVRLVVRQTASRLVLEVVDDGCGMRPTREYTAGRTGHWGLAGMRERARTIGARFTLSTVEGQGTRIRLQVRLRGVALRWPARWVGRDSGQEPS
jgi:signal transduction histidine kinase